MRNARHSVAVLLFLTASCASSPDAPVAGDIATSDVQEDAQEHQEDVADGADSEVPGSDIGLRLMVAVPIVVALPIDPLAGTDVVDCAVLDETTACEGGKQRRCALFDSVKDEFIENPDPLLERTFLFDRWYDLYHSPDGQTAERYFTEPMPAGTPEAVWGDPGRFFEWGGAGDSAIWSGTALTAYVLRYSQTGTEADYARMERKVRDILTLFDVTGIPGYLARYHFLRVPSGSPRDPSHIIRTASEAYDYKDHTFSAEALPDLPDVYRKGLPGPEGTLIPVEPMWHGNPSIDQYSGPLTGLPLAWALLRDDTVKARIATHLTCYLKRLERVEVKNLQKNPDGLAAFQALAGGGGVQSEPGDFDFTKLDTLVAYVLPQFNSKNSATYPVACPDSVALTPSRVLDAAADDFVIQLLSLANDVGSGNAESPTGIDHLYISVRGGDAMHLIHMAAIAFLMTGEPQYKAFAEQTAIEELHALEIAQTTGAFRLPPWCTSFYGHHITFTPAWSLHGLLTGGPLKDAIAAVFEDELWGKLLGDHKNAKFDLLYAAVLPTGAHAEEARARAIAQLETLGGNGGILRDPRRGYTLTYESVLAALPEDTLARCPTADERTRCEDGVTVFGIEVPGESITHPCTGAASDCPMEDGTCATALASLGLPSNLRIFQDFLWQRSPFEMGDDFGLGGYQQSPGLDLIEAYWIARHTGAITAGKGVVLAWQESGCN